jgi:phospholipid-binding lipoprotein MlaA
VKIAIRALTLSSMMVVSMWSGAAESTAPNPDPWEPFNRKVFTFNDYLDRYFLKPVAKGYETVTPQFLEDGVHHMFSNLGEISNFLNSLLQAKFKNTAESGGRFAVNSTIGLLGFFDVASKIGMQEHAEDFGQTLGYWGVHSGPYLVVPLLGSRTVRDGFGSVADTYSDPLPPAIDHVPTRNEVLGVRVIDSRAQLLKAEELISGDRYIFIRDAYLQRRQFLISDGAVTDSFGGDDFMDDEAGGSSGEKQSVPAGPQSEPAPAGSD